jgi:hypothetical protein
MYWLLTGKRPFDAATEPFRLGNAGEGLAALALVALGIAISLALRQRGARGATAVLALACGTAAFFAVRTLDHLGQHDTCVEAARHGEGELVEGTIERLRPSGSLWPWSASERLLVDGQEVRYPVLASGCGFSRKNAQAAGVREGAAVRVLVWHDQILRVDVVGRAQATRRTAPVLAP